MDCNASTVTRDLDNLKSAGWAEQTKTETWRLSPHVVQLSLRHAAAMRLARTEFDDVTQRYGNH
jgi:DNA-binding IclR family transcriptional regulator